MQVTTSQLRSHLKQGIQSVYFVYGDEPLQLRDNTDMIRKAAHYYGFEEREVYHADNQFNWQQLQQAASEISLFSSKKLIEIYLANGKPGDKGTKAIIEYCQNRVEDNILLIYTGELNSSVKKSKWFKQLQTSAVIVAVYPLKGQALNNWLSQRLTKEKLSCDDEAINFLAELIEGNLLAADQEIIKLSLLYAESEIGECEIKIDQLAEAITDNSRYKGFDLFDTALKGQSKQVLAMLNSFEHDRTPIQFLVFIIIKEVRMLASITAYQQQMPLHAAMSKEFIFAQRKPLIEQLLVRLSSNNNQFDWQNSLLQLFEIEKQSKGVCEGSPWKSLTLLLLGISQHISQLH